MRFIVSTRFPLAVRLACLVRRLAERASAAGLPVRSTQRCAGESLACQCLPTKLRSSTCRRKYYKDRAGLLSAGALAACR